MIYPSPLTLLKKLTYLKVVRFGLLVACIEFSTKEMIAQKGVEIDVLYSPSFSKLTSDFFEPRFFHSFGVELHKTLEINFQFGGGLYYRRFGATFELPPDISHIRPYKVSYLTTSISIPLEVGYYYFAKKNFKTGIDVGIENSILLDQKGKRPERTSEIGIYESYFLGFAASLPFQYRVSSDVSLKVEPFWMHQLNRNKSPYKQLVWGLNIGISIIFNSDKKV